VHLRLKAYRCLANQHNLKEMQFDSRNTKKVWRGLVELSFKQIMDICSTVVAPSEKTYRHLKDKMWQTAAVVDFRRREDGTIEAI